MASMKEGVIASITAVAEAHGFRLQRKPDGAHLYVKNLVFSSADYPSDVFIHRETGIDPQSARPKYLKVAVHPTHFRPTLIDCTVGINDYPNARTGINRHSGSNYVGFPTFEGNNEPCASCYKVDLDALGRLLDGLRR